MRCGCNLLRGHRNGTTVNVNEDVVTETARSQSRTLSTHRFVKRNGRGKNKVQLCCRKQKPVSGQEKMKPECLYVEMFCLVTLHFFLFIKCVPFQFRIVRFTFLGSSIRNNICLKHSTYNLLRPPVEKKIGLLFLCKLYSLLAS